MVDLARGRFDYLTNSLYTYWNPDYNSKKSNSKSAAAHHDTTAVRQLKPGAIMDERWWFWNLAFAALPSIVIVLYCELWAGPAMRRFGLQQELAELRVVMGDGDDGDGEFDEERALRLIEQRQQEMREKTLLEQALGLWKMLQLQLGLLEVPPVEDSSSSDEGSGVPTTTGATPPSANRSSDATATSRAPPVVPRPSVEPAHDVPESATTVTTVSSAETASPKIGPTKKYEPSMEEILERIRQLEASIAADEERGETTEQQDQRFLKAHERLQNQLGSSGAKSRVEDEAFQKWKPFLKSAAPQPKTTTEQEKDGVDEKEETSMASKLMEYVMQKALGRDDDEEDQRNERNAIQTNASVEEPRQQPETTTTTTNKASPPNEPPKVFDTTGISQDESPPIRKPQSVETEDKSSTPPHDEASAPPSDTDGPPPWWKKLWPRGS